MGDTEPPKSPQCLVKEEHVKAALKVDKGKDAKLTSWSIVDFTSQGDNYSCVVTSVRVKFSLHQYKSEVVYIVKVNPCRSFEKFEEYTQTIFIKEAEFYLYLLPELDSALQEAKLRCLRFPRCYYGSLESGREIIFLEDLRASGFKMYDRHQGLDVAHTTLILEELARLHAASRLLQDKTPDQDLTTRHTFLTKDWTSTGIQEKGTLFSFIELQLQGATDILSNIEGYQRAKTWTENLTTCIQDTLDKQLGNSQYSVVCHGDCWNNNALFRYNAKGEPEEVMLVDFQLTRHASLATDLNYLLYTSLTGEVRKTNLEAFLTTYHTAFTTVMEAAGKDTFFTQDQLLKEFRDKNVVGAIFAMIIMPLAVLKTEDVPDLSSGNDEDFKAKVMQISTALDHLITTNASVRERYLSVFDELMEAGAIP